MNSTLIIDDNNLNILDDNAGSVLTSAPLEFNNIKKIIFKTDTLISLKRAAFANMKLLEEVELSDSIISLGESTFFGCGNLKKVKLGKNIKKIPAWTFKGCINLEEIEFPDSVIEIGKGAFNFCYKIKRVKLNEGLHEIASYAFASCTSLIEISIPNSVMFINEFAFGHCPNLVKFNISKDSNLMELNLKTFGTVNISDKDLSIERIKRNSGFSKIFYLINLTKNTHYDQLFFLRDITENPNNIFKYIGKYNIELEDIKFLLNEEEYHGFLNGSNYGI
jgi:hypothetical protein